MANLPDELFSLVENKALAAREAAEKAALASINTLAVNRPTPYDSMGEGARQLRRELRAKARQLGEGNQTQGLQPLVEEIAYQQWHRMLFARFLAENDLLMHPSGVPVTLKDCDELAQTEGEADAWAVAAKYASEMLPGIFREEDPVVRLRFAPEGFQALERILDELPDVVFKADDSLGWMYQFWQSKKKDEINKSEEKIGAKELPAVTQLFTENYMVRFLLENSLGAWWAGKHPDSPLLDDYAYLRYKEDGTPAAGTFEGWPDTATEVTVMDPCCGSGHFLVAAFEMLRKIRMMEEDLTASEAGDAVIRDNLHGLEIDLRATQIAAFSLALIAWKTGGYRELPAFNIACSGIPVQGSLDSWVKLAAEDFQIQTTLRQLHSQFIEAATYGSLIDIYDDQSQASFFRTNYEKVDPYLSSILSKEKTKMDPELSIFGNSAVQISKVANLLFGTYSLVVTNVPYLGRGKQNEIIKELGNEYYQNSKNDLATMFIERSQKLTKRNSTIALVSPQSWLYQKKYENFRKDMLINSKWNFLAILGANAFRAIAGEVVNVVLLISTETRPNQDHKLPILTTNGNINFREKADLLKTKALFSFKQSLQLTNPDCIVIPEPFDCENSIENFADVYEGLHTGDYVRFGRKFWELPVISGGWHKQQGSPEEMSEFSGRENILFWEDGNGELIDYVKERLQSETVTLWIKGHDAWGKKGIAVSPMSQLKSTLFTGDIFTHSVVVVIPKNEKHLNSLWKYVQSDMFTENVRKIDRNLAVAVGSFRKIPFDPSLWAHDENPFRKISSVKDPTQWVYNGNMKSDQYFLFVAVARILGYVWPEQKSDELEPLVDDDGILSLMPVAGSAPAVDKLRTLLQAAYGEAWSAQKQAELLAEVGYAGKTLREWLQDGFFKQHVKLFHNRPFIWHIWDGRKDGFNALVNYHRLDSANLDRLIYTYLGDWIRLQRDKRDLGEPGADGRLVAALELKEKLEAISEGEPPYDIYVRWKSLAEQPISWNPDLNDGVRLNIRPFVKAGVLRNKFTIHWKKDRGKNPDGSERINDLHYTIEEKKRARQLK